MPKLHPYDLTRSDLDGRLEDAVSATFAELQSQFLYMPRGTGYLEASEFQSAYEVLRRDTSAFSDVTAERIWVAFRNDALTFVVLRTILGFSPPEWADVAKVETGVVVPQNVARTLDTKVRKRRNFFVRLPLLTQKRVEALVDAAVTILARGAPGDATDVVHRLAKFDTSAGLSSIRNAADHHVPYPAVLYERYLGRPFASHRDAVSQLVGDVMESAVEELLMRADIPYRKTGRAERIPGFEQAPDFFVPTELAPAVVLEAKITNDDGTARDKVARILQLANMRDARIREGRPAFQLVACIDGRGFGVRRDDMRKMLRATNGKVFTLSTLPDLIHSTDIRTFLPAVRR